jgi:GTP-binding protein
VLNQLFIGYQPFKGDIDKSRKGSLIATAQGITTSHAILLLEPRGSMFVRPNDKVYPGMIVGEHNKEFDIDVNPVKLKALTNVRAVSKDEFVKLTPARALSLEQVLSFIQGILDWFLRVHACK